MFVRKNDGPRTVTLHDGSILTIADLPPANTRWVASRKAIVVNAVSHGLISLDEALRRYSLTEEEFESWKLAIQKHGKAALKVTLLQRYRNK